MVKCLRFLVIAVLMLLGGQMTAADKPSSKIEGRPGGVVQALLFSMSKSLDCDSVEMMTFSIPESDRIIVLVRKECRGKLEDEFYLIVHTERSWAPTRLGNAKVTLSQDKKALVFENKTCAKVDNFAVKGFSIE